MQFSICNLISDNAAKRFLSFIRDMKAVLREYCAPDDAGEKKIIPDDTLKDILNRTITASDDLDMDVMEGIVNELRSYSYEGDIQGDIDALIEAAELMDVFTCSEIASKLLSR